MRTIDRRLQTATALGILGLCLHTMMSLHAGPVLEKQLTKGRSISVLAEEKRFGPNSPEAEAVRQAWIHSLEQREGRERAARMNIRAPLGWKKLIARFHTPRSGKVHTVWTNTLLLIEAEHGVNELEVLDATEVEGRVFLCYKERGQVYVEQIPPRPQAQRQRQQLARDLFEYRWTNALFTITTDGRHLLTARQRHRDATLVWQYQGGEWLLERQGSQPESTYEKALRDWSLRSLEGDLWVIIKRHPGVRPDDP